MSSPFRIPPARACHSATKAILRADPSTYRRVAKQAICGTVRPGASLKFVHPAHFHFLPVEVLLSLQGNANAMHLLD